nr:hypothetical protein [Paraburkholderia sp. BL8N3]
MLVGIERIGCVSYSQSTLPGKIGNVLVLVYQGLRERQLCIADYLEAAGIIERNNQGQKGKRGRAVKAIATDWLTASALSRFRFSAAARHFVGEGQRRALAPI